MTAAIPGRPPLMRFERDQATVPPAVRARDLVTLGRQVAAETDPLRPVTAADFRRLDRVVLAMALPNLADEDAQKRLADIVGELHEAELAEKVDPREDGAEYVGPEEHLQCAASLARDAVDADLSAQRPALRLVRGGNMPMAGAR